MRGTILGYDGAIGAILGEDGKRYSFVIAEWRGDVAPAARDTIDFIERGSDASQIYPMKAGDLGTAPGGAVQSRLAAAEKALNDANVTDTAARVKATLATQPQVILAGLLLVFACAFNWVSIQSGGSEQISKSMIGFVDYAGTILGPLTTSVARMEEIAQQARDVSVGGAAGIAATGAAQTASISLTLLKFAPILYIVPLSAILLLITAYRKRRYRVLELAAGVVALLTYPIALVGRNSLAYAIAGSVPFSLVDQATAKAAITLGWGAWFVPLAGIGLILTALGLLRRTPGL